MTQSPQQFSRKSHTIALALLLVCFGGNQAAWAQHGANAVAPLQATAAMRGLGEIVALAKLRDATWLAAQAQFQADSELEKQALAGLLPSINARATVDKLDSKREILGNSQTTSDTPKTYSAQLVQPLFRIQNWQSWKQGQLNSEIAKFTLAAAEQDLILRVSRAYFDVLAAQDELTNLESQKTTTNEQLAFAKRNFEVGTATITDQQEAQARYDLIVAQELAAKNVLQVRRLALETLIGEPVGELAPLVQSAKPISPTPAEPNAWAERARSGNLQVLQALAAQEIADREVTKSQANHLPTLDLNVQYVDATQKVFDNISGRSVDLNAVNNSIGLVLNVPIFSGGATQSKVRQQAALLSKSRQQTEQAVRGANQAARASFLNVTTGLAQTSALQTAVESSQLALQANKTGYEVGVRINLDVLNAQQQVSAAKKDLLRAKYAALIALLELQASVGQLNTAELEKINNLLATNGSK